MQQILELADYYLNTGEADTIHNALIMVYRELDEDLKPECYNLILSEEYRENYSTHLFRFTDLMQHTMIVHESVDAVCIFDEDKTRATWLDAKESDTVDAWVLMQEDTLFTIELYSADGLLGRFKIFNPHNPVKTQLWNKEKERLDLIQLTQKNRLFALKSFREKADSILIRPVVFEDRIIIIDFDLIQTLNKDVNIVLKEENYIFNDIDNMKIPVSAQELQVPESLEQDKNYFLWLEDSTGKILSKINIISPEAQEVFSAEIEQYSGAIAKYFYPEDRKIFAEELRILKEELSTIDLLHEELLLKNQSRTFARAVLEYTDQSRTASEQAYLEDIVYDTRNNQALFPTDENCTLVIGRFDVDKENINKEFILLDTDRTLDLSGNYVFFYVLNSNNYLRTGHVFINNIDSFVNHNRIKIRMV